MMAKSFLVLITLIITTPLVKSQSVENERKGFIRVFSNFKQGLTDEDQGAGFEIRRVYIGYKGSLSDAFKAEVKLDIGSPDDLSQFSLIRRYAYFKTAAITYNKNGLTGWFGLFDMQQFKVQEDFWGYRYLYKSFQDEQKFGPSADIGAGLKYEFTDWLSTDLVLSNGEGYRNFEHNNFIKYGGGITLSPIKYYTLRIYYDLIHSEKDQTSLSLFTGYNHPDYRVGAEYNLRHNHRFIENHSLNGYSIYGTWVFNPSWEVFFRYDRLSSNLLSGEDFPWNLYNDGTSIISGCQYTPVEGLKVSLNYQDRYSLARNGPDIAYIFLNLQFDL